MIVGNLIIGEHFEYKQFEQSIYYNDYPVSVSFSFRDGGYKKNFLIGADNCPIKKIKFSKNEYGCSNATIEFAYLDWSLDKYDRVDIFFKGNKLYHGLIDDKCDIDGGEVAIVPRRVRFEHVIFPAKEYSENISALNVLQEVIETKTLLTGISFNSYFIDNDFKSKDILLVNPKYPHTEMKKMIDDLVKTIDSDAFWGVNENNIFFIRYPETEVSQRLFASEEPYYTKIKVKTQYSNIEMTRAIVYRKGDTEKEPIPEPDEVYCGKVCYEDSLPQYPTQLNLENEVGIIEQVITVSSVVEDSTALDYAFNKIVSQQIKQTIEASNIDILTYLPEVFKKIQVEKKYTKKVLNTISDCNTMTGWSGQCNISSIRAIEGTTSIRYYGYGSAFFELENNTLFEGIEKVELFIFSLELTEITIELYKTPFEVIKTYKVKPQNQLWQRVEIDVDFEFSGLKFSGNSIFWIDRIKVYSYYKEIYESNVKEVDFIIDSTGYKCNMTLGNYDVMLNDKLQYLDWKIKTIDTINKI